MTIPASRPIYDNWSVYGPDGTLMFRTNEKRAKWYLDRGLAVRGTDYFFTASGSSIRPNNNIHLTFQPKGPGAASDPFYLQDFHNECVVCGATDGLCRVHVVPYAYRRWFPDGLKNHSSHDVLAMCMRCSRDWERHAVQYNAELCEMHGIPPSGLQSDSFSYALVVKAKKAACALLRDYETGAGKIPEPRVRQLYAVIADVYPHLDPYSRSTWRWAANVPKPAVEPAGKVIVEKYEGNVGALLRGVIFPWRCAFLDAMRPARLPGGWSAVRNGR